MTPKDSPKNILNKELDIMTDYLLNGDEINFTECVINWYRREYPCALTPIPTDTDEIRLAVKASLMERMVAVFNSPPRNGQEVVPQWCKRIKGLKAPMKLQNERLLKDEELCDAFANRNLHVVKNFMFFI